MAKTKKGRGGPDPPWYNPGGPKRFPTDAEVREWEKKEERRKAEAKKRRKKLKEKNKRRREEKEV